MRPRPYPPLPPETARAAQLKLDSEDIYRSIGDRLADLLSGFDPAALDPSGFIPGNTTILIVLVTLFQYAEGLPDRLAAEAVQRRVDWKYALHLPLSYPGFYPKVLCEFRQQLLVDGTGQLVLGGLLLRLAAHGLFGPKRNTRESESRMMQEVCMHTRADQMQQALQGALEALASQRPEWLLSVAQPHWYERYHHPAHLVPLTGQVPGRRGDGGSPQDLAQAIGADGLYLLQAIAASDGPGLADIPEIQELEQLWKDQFLCVEGKYLWREAACAHCLYTARLTDLNKRVQRGDEEVS